MPSATSSANVNSFFTEISPSSIDRFQYINITGTYGRMVFINRMCLVVDGAAR